MLLPAYLYGVWDILQETVCRHIGMIHRKDSKDQIFRSIYWITKMRE